MWLYSHFACQDILCGRRMPDYRMLPQPPVALFTQPHYYLNMSNLFKVAEREKCAINCENHAQDCHFRYVPQQTVVQHSWPGAIGRKRNALSFSTNPRMSICLCVACMYLLPRTRMISSMRSVRRGQDALMRLITMCLAIVVPHKNIPLAEVQHRMLPQLSYVDRSTNASTSSIDYGKSAMCHSQTFAHRILFHTCRRM